MRRRVFRELTKRTSAAAFMLTLLASAALAQNSEEARYRELPEFHQVNAQLYRGAQPRDGGLRKLSELGIKTVVSLRGENEITFDERKEAESSGMRYFSIPLPGLSRPSDEQVERILAIINATENQPVFVHCNHGKDRTGTIVAVYRITHDGWTSEQAKAEAKRYGMSWVQRGMKDYISDYYRDWTKQRAGKKAASERLKEKLLSSNARALISHASLLPARRSQLLRKVANHPPQQVQAEPDRADEQRDEYEYNHADENPIARSALLRLAGRNGRTPPQQFDVHLV